MTLTQINRLANSIYQFELIAQDSEAPEDKKNEARSQISSIALMLSRLPNGMEAMEKIDMIVEKRLDSLKNKKEG